MTSLRQMTCLQVAFLSWISCWTTCWFQVIARIVDGSKFDEFKAMYGETLVTGKSSKLLIFVSSKTFRQMLCVL